jgi:hypothetical protein
MKTLAAVGISALILCGVAGADVVTADTIVTGHINIAGATSGDTVISEPLINWAVNGEVTWQMGLDVANAPLRDFVLLASHDPLTGTTGDIIYVRPFAEEGVNAIGLNSTPPAPSRVTIGNGPNATVPNLIMFAGEGQSADLLELRNSAGTVIGGISSQGRVRTEEFTPPSSSSPCRRGEMTWDQQFVYICVADDLWKRAGLESW